MFNRTIRLRNWKRWLLPAALLLALAATLLRVPTASSQGVTLVAKEVKDDLPADNPDSPLWDQAAAVEVPLAAQVSAVPKWLNPSIKGVTVRALHNDSRVAFRVEWADQTKDDRMVRVDEFRDAVAIQFALSDGQPFFCMGQAGGLVNIWQWKADWEADLAAYRDMEAAYPNMSVDSYPFTKAAAGAIASVADYDPTYLTALAAGNLFASPRKSSVEDLNAGGFGSLTSQGAAGQNVQGKGVWRDGKWRVVFDRALKPADDGDMPLEVGQVTSIAFAAWDGSNGERNGQKATSGWYSLRLEGQVPRPSTGWAQPGLPEFMQMIAATFAVGAGIWVVAAIVGRMGRRPGV
jgi:hypothetical protein